MRGLWLYSIATSSMHQRFVGDEFQSSGSVHSTAIPKACDPGVGNVADSWNQVVEGGFELVARVVRFSEPPDTRSANSRRGSQVYWQRFMPTACGQCVCFKVRVFVETALHTW